MNKTTTELLQPFCGISDVRCYLNSIFKKGDYLCASNGHCLVRMPDDGTVDIGSDNPENTINPDLIFKLDTWPADGFIPFEFSEPDVVKKCSECGGDGKVFEKDACDECDGEGGFTYGRHYYECAECDGDGEGEVRGATGGKVECDCCNGTGVEYQSLSIPDGRMFNYKYLLKLKALPGITYLPDHSDYEHGAQSMRFKFDNGIGLLMPIRK